MLPVSYTVQEDTVCPRSSDPFYVVTYYINWVTTSWKYTVVSHFISNLNYTVCPGSSDPPEKNIKYIYIRK